MKSIYPSTRPIRTHDRRGGGDNGQTVIQSNQPTPPHPRPQNPSDIDFVAASFVRKAGDIHEIRSYLAEQMAEFWPAAHPHPKIIAKIESTEGLQNFDEILAESDG